MASGPEGEPVRPRAKRLQGPGSEILRLLSYGSVRALRQLGDEGRRPSRIRVPSTTFHNHAAELMRVGAMERRVLAGPPRQVVYELGRSGAELCGLIDGWSVVLAGPEPDTPIEELDWEGPRRFAGAWAVGVVAGLLDGPRSRAGIEILVRPASGLTANQVGGLLASLARAGFLASVGAGPIYALTDLGRAAVGQLAASVRFERRYLADAVPATVADGVAALRATLPLVELDPEHQGLCEVLVEDRGDVGGGRAAGAWARVEAGRVVATGYGRTPGPPTAWIRGTIDDWMAAVIDRRPRALKAAGDRRLAGALVRDLHSRLYGPGRSLG